MFKRLYAYLIELAQSPRAPYALAALAFAESSVFPVPPGRDSRPRCRLPSRKRRGVSPPSPRRLRFWAACSATPSGLCFTTPVGQWLIHLYGYADKAAALKETYARWGALVILVKGLTPIPFKLVTIVSGLLGYIFPLFVLLSVITRGGRFFLLAAALNHFGDPLRIALERHFAVFLASMATIVVVGFFVAAYIL